MHTLSSIYGCEREPGDGRVVIYRSQDNDSRIFLRSLKTMDSFTFSSTLRAWIFSYGTCNVFEVLSLGEGMPIQVLSTDCDQVILSMQDENDQKSNSC